MEKIREKHFLYMIAYISLMIQFFICKMSTYSSFSFIKLLSIVLQITAIFSIAIKVYFDKHSIKSLLTMISLGLILVVAFFNSGLIHIFYFILLVLGAKDINLNWVLKREIKMRAFLIFFIIVSSLLGIIDNYEMVRNSKDIVVRYALGFNHANTLGQVVLSYISLKYYLNSNRRKIYNIIISIICMILINIIADSRTSVICILLIILLQILTNNTNLDRIKKIYKFTTPIIPLWAITSIILSIKVDVKNSFLYTLDKLVSHRFMQAQYVIEQYGFSILGQKIKFISSRESNLYGVKSMILDNAYLQLGICMGIIILILVCIAFILLLKNQICNKNYRLVNLIIIYRFLGMSENAFNYVFLNFTYLFLSTIIYKNTKQYIKYT